MGDSDESLPDTQTSKSGHPWAEAGLERGSQVPGSWLLYGMVSVLRGHHVPGPGEGAGVSRSHPTSAYCPVLVKPRVRGSWTWALHAHAETKPGDRN